MIYMVSGRTTGLWDRQWYAHSKLEARRMAAEMRTAYDPSNSDARVVVSRAVADIALDRDAYEDIMVWRGSVETRRWSRANS